MKRIDPVITVGIVVGHCPRCGSRYAGDISHAREEVFLECENEYCNHSQTYTYYWPDEQPKVTLRYMSSKQKVGYKSPKKKKKFKDPNLLKGQIKLPFEQKK